MGFFIMVLKKRITPTFLKTYKVNIISARLSSEDKSVDNFFDSHINGRKSVAIIAAGAIFARLPELPSNSTPNEKFDCTNSDWFS